MNYTYSLETFYLDKWIKLFSDTLHFCQGYLMATRNYSPRNAHRIIRSDGKIVNESPAVTEVSVGQVAGYPTAEQYESAAKRALEQAARIRARQTLEGSRRADREKTV